MHDLEVTYMPKPFENQAGSGMHSHFYLTKGGMNAFQDGKRLSQTARYFLGGIIEHAPHIALLTNPTVNSYKRLHGGMEAPKFAAWGFSNRSALARIAGGALIDIEVRNTDTSANPYLAFSAIILAGMDGIRRKIEPGEPATADLGALSQEELRKAGIKQLPGSLGEAIEAAESSDIVRQILGGAYDIYLEGKKKEWKRFTQTVTCWEKETYFDI